MTIPDPRELSALLDHLPADRPFTTAEALAAGVPARRLAALVGAELLCHPLRGVYVGGGTEDTLSLRLEILKLMVPEACVVTDRTAAWLWGAPMSLAPGDQLATPRISVFSPPGHRLRNDLTDSGERSFTAEDVLELEGVRLTGPLRTACDLGRLLHRDQALAAMDPLAGLGAFTLPELGWHVGRFRHYRGVVQLRGLVGLVDPLAGSPGESILRLRWHDAGLPRPRCQIEVPAPGGGSYFLDIGLEEEGYAAEYDGVEWHGPERQDHDDGRRAWVRCQGDWLIVVARKDNIHGPHQNAEMLLREGYATAVRRRCHRSG